MKAEIHFKNVNRKRKIFIVTYTKTQTKSILKTPEKTGYKSGRRYSSQKVRFKTN